jgi:DNA-binding transcriptional MerR regulator
MANDRQLIQTFTVEEAARLSQLSATMVDYLCRQQVLVPTLPRSRKRGRARRYSFGDVVMLRVLGRLLDAGVSVKRVKSSLRTLRKHHKEITATSLPAEYLATDGRNVYLWKNSATLQALDDKGQMNFAFVIELTRVQAEVSEGTRKLRVQGEAS